MSAPERRREVIAGPTHAQFVGTLVAGLERDWIVTIEPPKRTLDQNAIFHAICEDFAKAIPEYAGVKMDLETWKSVLIVSHAVATSKGGIQLVPDLENQGLVQVRESSARMSKARGSSLIDYAISEAIKRGVPLRDPRHEAP